MGSQIERIPIFEDSKMENTFSEVKPGIFRVEGNSEALIPNKNLLLIITGPTGAGKDTIRDLLPGEVFSSFKTCTTRPRRPIEPEGESDPYHRLSTKDFEEGIARGDFFEVNQYNGHYYGGRISDVQEIMSQNKIPVFRVDPQGAQNYQDLMASGQPPFAGCLMISVFVTPPDFEVLTSRLYKRDVEPYLSQANQDELLLKYQQRVAIAQNELDKMVHAHFVAINTDGCQERMTQNITTLVCEYLG
jgi:guanylate kinase